MEILNSLIDSVNTDDREIQKVIIGLYTTCVSNSDNTGLSSTLYFNSLGAGEVHRHFSITGAGDLNSKTGTQLCSYIYSDVIIEASIGMAALNSFIDVDREQCVEVNASTVIRKKGEGRTVAVIGHFPFVKTLKKDVGKLYVFELAPKDSEDLLPERMPEFLPEADVVAITGTSLLNHTFHDIMKHVNDNAFVVMLGPSTPMSGVMFDYGIDMACGSVVVDRQAVENCITQAVPFKSMRGVSHLALMKK